jgi:hypothetical protein
VPLVILTVITILLLSYSIWIAIWKELPPVENYYLCYKLGHMGKEGDKEQKIDELTMSDWLAFLESRSSNYIATMVLMISLIAIIAVVLSSIGESWMVISSLLLVAFIVIWLFDKVVGTPLAVEALEAKRISDEIIEGKLKTADDVRKAWQRRTKGRIEWVRKWIKKEF